MITIFTKRMTISCLDTSNPLCYNRLITVFFFGYFSSRLYNAVIPSNYMILNWFSKAISRIQAIIIIAILLSSITIALVAWNFTFLTLKTVV